MQPDQKEVPEFVPFSEQKELNFLRKDGKKDENSNTEIKEKDDAEGFETGVVQVFSQLHGWWFGG